MTGAEAVTADPDRVATVIPALAQVAVVCILLGSATGRATELEALHGPRLEMLLTKLIDTPVRGVVYEVAGTVDAEILRAGAERVSEFCRRSRIPFALLGGGDGAAAIERVLAGETVETGEPGKTTGTGGAGET